MRTLIRLSPLLVAVGIALPSSSLAQQTIAPPGKSGADQYFETIPTGKGNAAPPSGAATGGSGGAQIGSLARLGKDGGSAASLAAATAPTKGRHGAESSSASGGRSPLSSLTNLIGGSDEGGIGIILPILLAAILALAIAVVLARLRRGDEGA